MKIRLLAAWLVKIDLQCCSDLSTFHFDMFGPSFYVFLPISNCLSRATKLSCEALYTCCLYSLLVIYEETRTPHVSRQAKLL